jgi:hypothetical protein
MRETYLDGLPKVQKKTFQIVRRPAESSSRLFESNYPPNLLSGVIY